MTSRNLLISEEADLDNNVLIYFTSETARNQLDPILST